MGFFSLENAGGKEPQDASVGIPPDWDRGPDGSAGGPICTTDQPTKSVAPDTDKRGPKPDSSPPKVRIYPWEFRE